MGSGQVVGGAGVGLSEHLLLGRAAAEQGDDLVEQVLARTQVTVLARRVADEADLVEYRDMLTIIRDRIADLIQQGKTLDQVKAAQPTLDFDGRYGAPTDSWNKEMFVEAVYTELAQGKAKN